MIFLGKACNLEEHETSFTLDANMRAAFGWSECRAYQDFCGLVFLGHHRRPATGLGAIQLAGFPDRTTRRQLVRRPPVATAAHRRIRLRHRRVLQPHAQAIPVDGVAGNGGAGSLFFSLFGPYPLADGVGWVVKFIGFSVALAVGLSLGRVVAQAQARQRPTSFGSAKWATYDYLAENKLFVMAGFLLGEFAKKDRRSILRYEGARHLLTVAPTRSGKGVSSIRDRDGFPISGLRPLLAVLPETECPAPRTHERGSFLDGEVQSPPSCAQLRWQRIALLAPEFGFGRPQGHRNARHQKSSMTQIIWLSGRGATCTRRLTSP